MFVKIFLNPLRNVLVKTSCSLHGFAVRTYPLSTPRKALLVPHCSNYLQEGQTNQNPPSAYIYLKVFGGPRKDAHKLIFHFKMAVVTSHVNFTTAISCSWEANILFKNCESQDEVLRNTGT